MENLNKSQTSISNIENDDKVGFCRVLTTLSNLKDCLHLARLHQ